MCYKTTSGEYDQKKKKINEVHFNIGNKFMITQWVWVQLENYQKHAYIIYIRMNGMNYSSMNARS